MTVKAPPLLVTMRIGPTYIFSWLYQTRASLIPNY